MQYTKIKISLVLNTTNIKAHNPRTLVIYNQITFVIMLSMYYKELQLVDIDRTICNQVIGEDWKGHQLLISRIIKLGAFDVDHIVELNETKKTCHVVQDNHVKDVCNLFDIGFCSVGRL